MRGYGWKGGCQGAPGVSTGRAVDPCENRERERERAYTECALQRTALMVQSVVRLDQINQNFTTEFNLEIVKYVVVDIHFSQGAPDLYVLNPIEF